MTKILNLIVFFIWILIAVAYGTGFLDITKWDGVFMSLIIALAQFSITVEVSKSNK